MSYDSDYTDYLCRSLYDEKERVNALEKIVNLLTAENAILKRRFKRLYDSNQGAIDQRSDTSASNKVPRPQNQEDPANETGMVCVDGD